MITGLWFVEIKFHFLTMDSKWGCRDGFEDDSRDVKCVKED